MTRRHVLLGGIAVIAAAVIGYRVARPQTPDIELSNQVMDKAEIAHTLSESDTDTLLRLLRSNNPETVRNALGTAMMMTRSARKGEILDALSRVTIPNPDVEGVAQAIAETRRRLSR